jgi:hypothetical protein
VLSSGLLYAREAGAQLRWDASAQVGVMQRFTTGRDANVPFPGIGPVAELSAHIAILPLLRVGPYVSHDLSPLPGAGAPSARQITEFGLEARLAPPLLPPPWHTWVLVGLGYARTYEPSYPVTASDGSIVVAQGLGGGILEGRLGVGLGYRVTRSWEIFAELGGRVGLAFSGSMYSTHDCGCPNLAPGEVFTPEPYPGKDSFALSLSLGLSLNQ